MSTRYSLLKLLADRQYHSGNQLARKLQISRAAIWKSISSIKDLGIAIESRHGKGYKLLQALDLLDEIEIRKYLNFAHADIEIHAQLTSTNLYLLEQLSRSPVHNRVVMSEYQSGGRGRRGKNWLSPFASGLYLSIGWHFDAPPASLNALSLACGVAVIYALRSLDVETAALKWPNDIMANEAKLAGILIESRSETATSCDVVIGIGMNVKLDESYRQMIAQPVIDLDTLMATKLSRSQIAAHVINEQFAMLNEVALTGPASFIQSWRQFDYLVNKAAVVNTGKELIAGIIKGVDDNGLLIMLVDGVEKQFSSGEVSLRARL